MPQPPHFDDTSAQQEDDALDRIELLVRDFRGLREVGWEIDPGVSLLVGPNGSGKTSLLSAWAFLGEAYAGGVGRAIRVSQNASSLRRRGAEMGDLVRLGLQLGSLRWELQLAVEGHSIHPNPGERLALGSQILLERAVYSSTFEMWLGDGSRQEHEVDDRACLRIAADLGAFDGIPDVSRLHRLLRTRRSYFGFWPRNLRDTQKEADYDVYLHPSGRNLYGVLRNWMGAPRKFDGQFDWVLSQLRRAFPDQVDGIEFDAMGRLIDARFFAPGLAGADTGLPLSAAADGLLVGLALLTAVAGAPAHSLVVIDELENHLHPHAIRSILAAMRSRAEERDLRIVVTTHSPVAMNEFRDEPERVYVLEPGLDVVPRPLTELHDPDWLAHFALGDLYEREKFAAPRPTG